MKGFIKGSLINSLSLFIVSIVVSGVTVTGGIAGYIIAGLILFVLSTVLDPIVKVITLPFNVLTLGLLSFLTTLVALFLMSFFYSGLTITGFDFPGFSFLGIHVSRIYFSGVLSYFAISATIYFLTRIINWIFSE